MECSDPEGVLPEAQRRLRLLGPLATAPYNYDRLRERASETYVPLKVLWTWWHAYKRQDIDGLVPPDWLAWNALSSKIQEVITKRLALLGEVVHATTFPDACDLDAYIPELAQKNEWSLRTAERWVRRYQVGGWWSLAPSHDPATSRHDERRPLPPDLGALDEETLAETFRRRGLLGPLAKQPKVSRTQVETRAGEVGVAPRTIWHYLKRYRDFQLAGLAPKERSDKHASHLITPQMEEVIRGVRFSQPKLSVRAVYEAVREKAQALGEPTPSEWQVRRMCQAIAKPELALAERDDKTFRNSYEVTRRMEQTRREEFLISYQIDHTLVDVLVKDGRTKKYQTKSKEIRPWLTLCIDSRSRVVMSAIFAYDRPDRHTVAAVIRDAVLLSDKKSYGGIPHEIWVDNGKELVSQHVYQLTEELHIQLEACAPHRPQQKGIIERFFGTLNTRHWSRLAGYVDSNTVERNPHAHAELSLMELEEGFWAFVTTYHQEIHSQTHEAPLAYWANHCYAEPANPRELDVLLKERDERRVFKDGIHYRDRLYWHQELPTLVGSDVLIRAAPIYRPPEEIEVYQDGNWICTAIATDSDLSQGVTREEMGKAKQEQKAFLNHRIKASREAVQAVDQEIANVSSGNTADNEQSTLESETQAEASQPLSSEPTAPPPQKKTPPQDLFERMAEQEAEKGEAQ